ncbi:hypothetical protein HK104_003179, partial [Borealophlyctis nickersoniae]
MTRWCATSPNGVCRMLLLYGNCVSFSMVALKDGPPILLPLWDWGSTVLTHQVFRIIVEERIGYRTQFIDAVAEYAKLLEERGTDDYFELQMMTNGTYHLDMEHWTNYLPPNDGSYYFDQLRSVVIMGPLGFIGQEGWFFPSYMLEINENLDQYGTYRFAEAAALFARNDIPYTDIRSTLAASIAAEQKKLADESINQGKSTFPECIQTSGSYDETLCLEKTLDLFMNLTGSGGTSLPKGVLYTPGEAWEVYDGQIVKNLNLWLEMSVVDRVEEALVALMTEGFNNKHAFLTYWYTPHSIFSKASGISLSRVSLPQYTDECIPRAYTGEYNCDFPPTITRKIASRKVKEKWPKVATFIQNFQLRQTDMIDILGDVGYGNMTSFEAACKWVLAKNTTWQSYLPSMITDCPPGTTLGEDS